MATKKKKTVKKQSHLSKLKSDLNNAVGLEQHFKRAIYIAKLQASAGGSVTHQRNAKKALKFSQNGLSKATAMRKKAKATLDAYEKSQKNKNKRKKANERTKKIISHLQSTKNWKNHQSFVMPAYPGSDHSYVWLFNISETNETDANVSTNAVSAGQYINYYTQSQPRVRSISAALYPPMFGYDLDDKAELYKQFRKLEKWARDGTELCWHGYHQSKHTVFTQVSSSHDNTSGNTIPVSIAFQDVNWAKSNVSSKSTKSKSSGKKSAKKGTRKKTTKYVVVKKGDTYSRWHKIYGTSIADLRKWNGWSDRGIPVGKRARVK